MKQDWHPDELAQHWTLSAEERELLDSKTSATRLSFAVLLKAFRFDGRFPERREDIAGRIVTYLASQTGVPPEAYSEGEWSERTQRYQRAQIRRHCGFRVFRIEDEPAFVAWLSERVTSPNPEAEALKIAAYEHLRSQSIEPPATERLGRLLRIALVQREERLVVETAAQLPPATRAALDALVKTQTAENPADEDQMPLFSIRRDEGGCRCCECRDRAGRNRQTQATACAWLARGAVPRCAWQARYALPAACGERKAP
jgi:hypothetical protein